MRRIIRQKIVDSLAAELPTLTRRDVRLPAVAGKAKAVIGPRRAGKTTFLWQILAEKLKSGVDREGLLYFNFEDERLAGMSAADLQFVVEEYYLLHPERRDRYEVVLFLDEIQLVPGWETFVRRLIDSERMEIYLSGSSARLLSREVATSMRGRAMEALVYPFSFREFLRHHGKEPDKSFDALPKAARSVLDKELRSYLVEGGFPEAMDTDIRDRFELLRGYVDAAMLRDIVERHAVSQPVALRWMVRHLMGNAGGAFSIHKFHGDLRAQGIPVSKDTLHAFLSYIEDAFLVRSISIATESERRRMANPRKAYPIDPGLIPVFDRSGRSNVCHALETVVALELDRRGAEITYVRTRNGLEVDFLARFAGGEEQLIQVCADLDSPETLRREIAALLEAGELYPRAGKQIITLLPEDVRELPDDISLHSAASWLLGE